MRRAAVSVVLIVLIGVAATAHAGRRAAHPRLHWSPPALIDPAVAGQRASLNDLSCPSSSLCIAVDQFGNVVSSTDPAGGAWRVLSVDPGVAFTGASCPSTSFCAVSGGGDVATSTNPAAATPGWTVAHIEPGETLQAIACSSARLCVAVDRHGRVLTSTNPSSGPSAWRGTKIARRFRSADILPSVSCPSALLCVISLVDYGKGEFVATSTHPRSGNWKVAPFGGGGGVSCPSTSFCAAVGFGTKKMVVSTKPTGGTRAWKARRVTASGPTNPHQTYNDVSCASKTLCAAAGGYGLLAHSYSPLHRPSTWRARAIRGLARGDRGFFYSVACPTVRLCVAGDRAGYVTVGRG